ncbi:hypothetical protein WDW86_10415 [Bdellovibrionota bacterium FG-2]
MVIDNVARTCVNFSDEKLIRCNNDRWNKTEGQKTYGVVFHEYLGILGYESNNGDYSQYPVSSAIMPVIYSTQKFELGMDRQPKPKAELLGRVVSTYEAPKEYCAKGKNEDLCPMTYGKAEEYCNSIGRRLPNLDELQDAYSINGAFQRPSGEEGNHWFWIFQGFANDWADVFDGDSGDIGAGLRIHHGFVRCINISQQ